MAVRRFVGLALLFGAPCLARGEPPATFGGPGDRDHYVAVRLGRFAGQVGGSGGRSSSEGGGGFDGEVTAGMRLSPRTAIEVGLGHYTLANSSSYLAYSSNSGYATYRDAHRVTSLAAGLRLLGDRIPSRWPLEFSAFAGLGLYQQEIARDVAATPLTGPAAGTTRHYPDSATVWGAGVHLGGAFAVTAPWGVSLGGELRAVAITTPRQADYPRDHLGFRYGAVVGYEF
jgi:hypothetical protein